MKFITYAETANSKQRQKVGSDFPKVETLTAKKLVQRYLCEGKRSPCVVKRDCELIESCRYGKRYLKLTEENNE